MSGYYVFDNYQDTHNYAWLGEGEYLDIVLNPDGEWITHFDLGIDVWDSQGVWFPSLSSMVGMYNAALTPVINIRMLGSNSLVDELTGFDFAQVYNRLYDIGYSYQDYIPSLPPIYFQDSGGGQADQFISALHTRDASWGVFQDPSVVDGFGGLIFGSYDGNNGVLEIGLISTAGEENDVLWSLDTNYGIVSDDFWWDSSTSSFYVLSTPYNDGQGIEVEVLRSTVSFDPTDGGLGVQTSEYMVAFSGLEDPLLQAAITAEDFVSSSLGSAFFEAEAFVQEVYIYDSAGMRTEFLVYDRDYLTPGSNNNASNLVHPGLFTQYQFAGNVRDYFIPDTYVYEQQGGESGSYHFSVQLLDLTQPDSQPVVITLGDIESGLKLNPGAVDWFEVVDRVGTEVYIHYGPHKAYDYATTFTEAPEPDSEPFEKAAVFNLADGTWITLDGSSDFASSQDFVTKDFYFWNDIDQTPLDIQWQLVDARGNVVDSIEDGTSEQISLRLYSLRDGVAESSSGFSFPNALSDPLGVGYQTDNFSFNLTVLGRTRYFDVDMGEGTGFKTYTDVSADLQQGVSDSFLSPNGAWYHRFWEADLDGDGYFETRVGDEDAPGDPYEFWLDFSKLNSEVQVFTELGLATIDGYDLPVYFIPAEFDVLYDFPQGLAPQEFGYVLDRYEVDYGFNAYKLGANAQFEGSNNASEIVSITAGSGHIVHLGGSVFGSDFDVISFRDYQGPSGFDIDLNVSPDSPTYPAITISALDPSVDTEFYVTGAEAVVGSNQGDRINGLTDRVNFISGEGGGDRITGGDYSDVIFAGFDYDSDSVFGGIGDDVLLGGANDSFEGGQGKDLLLFTSAQPGFTSKISDFELSSDRLSLSPRAGSAADRFGIGLDLSTLSAAFSQVGMMSSQIQALIDSARWSDDADNSSANIALRRYFDLEIGASSDQDGYLDVNLFLESDHYLKDGGDYKKGVDGEGRVVKVGDGPEVEVGPLATISMKVGEYNNGNFLAYQNNDSFEVISLPESYETFAKVSSQLEGADGSGRVNAFGYVSALDPYNATDATAYTPVAYSVEPSNGLGSGDVMLFHFAVARSVEGVVSAAEGVPMNFARRDSNGEDLNTIFRATNDTDKHVFLGGRAKDKYEFVGREFIEDTGLVSENQAFSESLVIERGVVPGQIDQDRDSIVVDGLSAFDASFVMQRAMLGREGVKSLEVYWGESTDEFGQIAMNAGGLQVFKQFDGVNTAFRVEDMEFVYEGESKRYDLGIVRVEVPQDGFTKLPIEKEIVTTGGRDAMLLGRKDFKDVFVIEADQATPANNRFEVHLWDFTSNNDSLSTEDVLEVRGYGNLLDIQRIQNINPPEQSNLSPEEVFSRGATLHYSGDLDGADDDVIIDLYLRGDFDPYSMFESVMVRTDADGDGSVDNLAAALWTDYETNDFIELDFSAQTLMDASLDDDQEIQAYVLNARYPANEGGDNGIVDQVSVGGVGQIQLVSDDVVTADVYDPTLLTDGQLLKIDVDTLPPETLSQSVIFEGLDETTAADNLTVTFLFAQSSSNSNDIDVFAYSPI